MTFWNTLLNLLQKIEPDAGVWIMAFGGGLVGTALREDSNIRRMFGNTLLGTLFGIACASLFTDLPRAPTALITSLFASPILLWLNKKVADEGPSALIFWKSETHYHSDKSDKDETKK